MCLSRAEQRWLITSLDLLATQCTQNSFLALLYLLSCHSRGIAADPRGGVREQRARAAVPALGRCPVRAPGRLGPAGGSTAPVQQRLPSDAGGTGSAGSASAPGGDRGPLRALPGRAGLERRPRAWAVENEPRAALWSGRDGRQTRRSVPGMKIARRHLLFPRVQRHQSTKLGGRPAGRDSLRKRQL